MGILDTLTKILQYPQSVATGAMGAMRTPLSFSGESSVEDFTNPLKRGLAGGYRPSDVYKESGGESGLTENVLDIIADPLMFAGPAAKALGLASKAPKAAKLIEQANTIGKIGEGATKSGKAAQFARRGYQGMLITGDPLYGLGAGTIIGAGEHAVSPLLRGISTRAARQAASANGSVEEVLNSAGDSAARSAPQLIGPPKPNSMIPPEGVPGIQAALQEAAENQLRSAQNGIPGIQAALQNADPVVSSSIKRMRPDEVQAVLDDYLSTADLTVPPEWMDEGFQRSFRKYVNTSADPTNPNELASLIGTNASDRAKAESMAGLARELERKLGASSRSYDPTAWEGSIPRITSDPTPTPATGGVEGEGFNLLNETLQPMFEPGSRLPVLAQRSLGDVEKYNWRRPTQPGPPAELNAGPPVRAHGGSPPALNPAPVPRPHEQVPQLFPEQLALNPAPVPIPHTGSLAIEPYSNPMEDLHALLQARVPKQTMRYEAPPKALPMGARPMGSGEFGPATEGASSVAKFQGLLGETSPESLEVMLQKMQAGRKPSGAFLDKVTSGQSAQLNELMADPQTRELVLAMLARSGT